MRRVWRLGQNKEVNVTFLAYDGTMEQTILNRMGQKMKFAQLLYGKEAAGCLVETDTDDIQREIINAALEGKAFRNAGEAVQSLSIFTQMAQRRQCLYRHRLSEARSQLALSSCLRTTCHPERCISSASYWI
jgi:hypothetical protein